MWQFSSCGKGVLVYPLPMCMLPWYIVPRQADLRDTHGRTGVGAVFGTNDPRVNNQAMSGGS